MKFSRNEINSRVHKVPEIRFEDQKLTSFAGLVVIQSLFARLRLKERLRTCFDHFKTSPIFGYHVIVDGPDGPFDHGLPAAPGYGLLSG